MKVIKWLDEHFEETFLVFFLVLISCITMLQIIARTFFAALSWPEEFCRYCWIWSVFISLPYTMRKGNMLRVNVLVDLLPTKVRNAINIVIDLINTVVMALFFNWFHYRDPKRPEQRPYLSRYGAAHGRCVHLPADRLRPGLSSAASSRSCFIS